MYFFQNKKKASSVDGFTLMELMIAIAIVGVMAALTVPNISSWRMKYSLKAAARELYSNIQRAKINAAQESQQWALVFDTGANTYSICDDPVDGDWTTAGDNICSTTISLSDSGFGLTFNNPDPDPLEKDIDFSAHGDVVVVFNTDGSSTAGYVTLTNNTPQSGYKISTSIAGIVMMEIWSGAGWN